MPPRRPELAAFAGLCALVALAPGTRAQIPQGVPVAPGSPYAPPPAAIGQFLSAQAGLVNGKWSGGDCDAQWYMWSVVGADITFRDQNGRVDVERVVEVRRGGFATVNVASNHAALAGLRWDYQFVGPAQVRIRNASTGQVFWERKCPAAPGPSPVVPAPRVTAAAIAPVRPPAAPVSVPAPLALPAPAHKPPLGPSYDCGTNRDPVGVTICGDDGLARLDMELAQAYYALRHLTADEGRQQLKLQAIEFHTAVVSRCGLPASGVPDPLTQRRAAPCVGEFYRAMRARYAQLLSGDAVEEVQRGLEEHIALQAALRTAGFLDPQAAADGIYGSGTRDAITRFQQARGLPATGFMSAQTARELARGRIASDPPAVTAALPGTAVAVPTTAAIAPLAAVGAAIAPAVPAFQPPPPSPQVPPAPVAVARRDTAATRKLGEQGQAEDLLILANTSPQAPNAALDLAGALAFPSGRAALCFGPETGQAFDDQSAVAQWLRARKVALAASPPGCADLRFADLDGVLVTRGAVGRLDPDLFNEVAARLQAGTAQAFVILSEADRRDARDRREVARAASEQAVKAGKPGFGYAVLPNESGTVCVVSPAAPADDARQADAWQAVLQAHRAEIEGDLGRAFRPKVMTTDADTAYIAGRRGACGVIVATAEQLATVFRAFERDRVRGGYGAVWFAPEAIQEAAASLQASRDGTAQATERARREAAQEEELRQARARAEGAEREARTRQLRATFEASAVALRDAGTQQTLAVFGQPVPRPGGDPAAQGWVRHTFADVAAQAARRTMEGWAFVEGGGEIVEYGRSDWNGRSLETGVIRVRLKLKNADIGRYDALCFDLAFQRDTEFQRIRSAQAFDCEAADQLRRWLAGVSYTSQWNAP